jgi:hypothetical protein
MLNKAACVAVLLSAALGLWDGTERLAVRSAQAQPAMLDPSQMSGIPRPDPQVPPATVTVRLIRGELSNRIVDAAVELVPQGGAAARSEKTNAEGRATFGELQAGVYTARASIDGVTLTSQPISVQAAPAPGIRVMLVFPKSAADQQKELGTADGKARVDQSSPAGSLLVKLVDETGKPLSGLKVTLLSASRADEKVESRGTQDSAADGTAKFSELRTGGEVGYMVLVEREGGRQQSQPFQLSADHGSQVAMTVRPVSQNVSALTLGPATHVIFEAQDDTVQVTENIQLRNSLEQPVDTGPAGLRIPLAKGALSPQVPPNGPSQLTVDASQDGPPVVVWKGQIPPGDTMISAAFVLRHRGSVTFQQQISVRAESLRVVAVKLPDLKIDGMTDSEDRKWNGRDLIVGTVALPGVGGSIELTLNGLPTDFYQLRILAVFLAAGIGLSFAYVAIYRRAEDEVAAEKVRARLMTQREALLDELINLEAGAAPSPAKGSKAKAPRDATQVRAELEDVYRRIDELNG